MDTLLSVETNSLYSHTLFDFLTPQIAQDPNGNLQIIPGPVIGSSLLKDTAKVNQYLLSNELLNLVPNE